MRNIKKIPVEQIRPNSYNPNELTEQQFKELKQELRHRGKPSKPIAVRKLKNSIYEIVDGEHEWQAAKELGFKQILCEVLDVDKIESMRQIVMRNRGGTNNPAKLGRMFEEYIKEKKCTQRKAAADFNISEGTLRNFLCYVEASRLRNGYAFEDLTVKQLRLYLELPPVIRDKWLDAGADENLLVFDRRAKFDSLNSGMRKIKLKGLQMIYDGELADKVIGTAQEFKKSAKDAYAFLSWEWGFHRDDSLLKEKVRLYTRFYIDRHKETMEFEEVFKLIFKPEEKKFLISPREFQAILKKAEKLKAEHDDLPLDFIQNTIQLKLVKKGLLEPRRNIRKLSDPKEELTRIDIEKNAPDYIRNSDLPILMKDTIWHFPMLPEPMLEPFLEDAKREVVKELSSKKHPQNHNITSLITSKVFELEQRAQLNSTTDTEIVHKIIANLQIYEDNEIKKQDKFSATLSKLTRKEKLVLLKASELYQFYKGKK